VKQLALGVRLRADAVFESFAPGSNRELIAVLRGGGSAPLWLWGGEGSGKTHLLQAVCAAAAGDTGSGGAALKATAPDAAAACAAAAYFPLERPLTLPAAALAGFENCSVLCIDDVDEIAGELQWEQALFRLFNEAAELGTRLIFAARAAPRGIDWSLDDWRSRAAASVVYQLRDLDDAGRLEALRLRAAQRGLQLPAETADYLLRRMPRDLPSLLEVLDHLDEASLVAQRRLTVPFIRDALEMLAGTKP
jgi:DnaA family protein